MPHSTTSVPLFLLLSLLPFLSTSFPLHTHPQPIIPHPQQQQTLLPLPFPFPSSNTATNTTTIIPSFPSQTSLSPCQHLPLPPLLLSSIHSSCIPITHNRIIKKTRCCPTLAAWLYWAYSGTALNGHDGIGETKTTTTATATTMNMPMMPDDSETCVEAVEEGMREKGVVLGKVNGSCGLVYCYCGIRLHGLSCPGFVTGDQRVRRLERDCRGGCDTCLHSLYQLGKTRNGSAEKIEDKRTSKMRSKECELMGITWLLAKNRSAYMDTVTSVLRAMMMSPNGSYPRSCSLKSNEFPIAVDSAEISSSTSASTRRRLIRLLWFSFCFLYFAF
ncbi:putative GPI-anchored protein [Drosera capensis]